MNRFIILLLVVLSFQGLSQNTTPYPIKWLKKYGGSQFETIFSIIPKENGNYVLGGRTSSNDGDIQSVNHGESDIWILEINDEGEILWEKTYGGNEDENLYAIESTPDKGYILGGSSESNNGDVKSGNHGSLDYWVVKIDSTGNIEWEKTYGGSSGELLIGFNETIDGGYILTGWSASNDGDIKPNEKYRGTIFTWIIKIDSIGNLEWEKSYGTNTISSMPAAIKSTPDGGYIFGGRKNLNIDFISHDFDSNVCWIVKIDSIGTVEWENIYSGEGLGFQGLCLTKDGGYICGGGKQTDSLSTDMWLLKIDSKGSVEWEKTYKRSSYSFLTSLLPNGNNEFIISCGTRPEEESQNKGIRIMQVDSDGNIIWEEMHGGSSYDAIWSFEPLPDGGFVLGGRTDSKDGSFENLGINETDAWIMRIGANSQPDDISISNSEVVENLPKGNVVGVLSTSDKDIFDSFTYTIISIDGETESNLFTISNDTLFANESFDYDTKPLYEIVIETIDFAGEKYSERIKINIINSVGLANDNLEYSDIIKIYPNPVQETFVIESNYSKPIILKLFDITGKEILIHNLLDYTNKIDLESIDNGIYFIKILDSNEIIYQQKIVKITSN